MKPGLFWLMLCALPLGAQAGERYRNGSGYGLALDIPAQACARTTPPPGPDHGLVLFYDGASCDADASRNRNRSSIEFFVAYNVGDGDDGEAARSARQLAGIECAGHKVGRSRERLDGLSLYECVLEDSPGFVKLKLVAQKPSRKDVGLWQNYLITISCRKVELALYRRRLHEVLRRASISDSMP